MLFYTIIKLFITLLENVNKSRTSAGSLSLSILSANGEQVLEGSSLR
jgi:hypothetical protein